MDYPERPESDFSIPETKLPVTTCGHCGDIHHLSRSITGSYIFNGQVEVEHFCSTDCYQYWQLRQMRLLGM